MNRLDNLIGAAFEEDARHAPPAGPVVVRVLARSSPRRARRGWLAAAAVAATTATVVAVSVTTLGGGEPAGSGTDPASGLPVTTGLVGTGAFEQRKVTYAEGSTIHYGDQTIDVAPHTISAFVPTDDGFVFMDKQRDVYFTNGDAVDQIGRNANGYDLGLAADDTGSYAGWTERNDVAVVYDTSTGQAVLRKQVGDGDPSTEEPSLAIPAVDDGTAYVLSYLVDEAAGPPWIHRIDAWDLTNGTSESIPMPERGFILQDSANGYLLWGDPDYGENASIVRGPGTERQRLHLTVADEYPLSPSGAYVTTLGQFKLIERATGRDVTPAQVLEDGGRVISQWLDDDRFVYDQVDWHHRSDTDTAAHALLVCSVSAATCHVAVDSLAGPVVYPDGGFNY